MVDLNDRGRAEEAKAALSEEVRFQAEARRNKRVGLWFASDILGLSGDEQQAFAAGVMDADFEESGSQDVIRFLRQQAENAGKIFDESAVLAKMSAEYEAALQELVPKSGFGQKIRKKTGRCAGLFFAPCFAQDIHSPHVPCFMCRALCIR